VRELDGRTSGKRLGRIAVVAACAIVVFLAVSHLGAFAFLPVAGVAVLLVYVLDAPQAVFSAFGAARRRLRGIKHDGRHDWYGFRGTTLRLFFDEGGKPWIAVKEIAQILEIEDIAATFSHYGPAEIAAQPFASSERCISEGGLRRYLKQSRHRDAHALLLWFEREVILPLQRRREFFPAASDQDKR